MPHAPLDSLHFIRLQRAVEHLHQLRPQATFHFVVELSDRIGGMPAITTLLAEYEQCDPAVLRAVGGDQFPARLRAVPR